MRIAPFTSFFLDALRLFAALGVVFVHLSNSRLAPSANLLQFYGEYFVVAFFVLSGFVISATTDSARADAVRYTAVRLARLWTVALPCLLLALILETVGGRMAPEHFHHFDRGYWLLRYILAATFTNEMWFFSAGPPMDLPVWSLAYEFWYYALFGLAVFIKKPLARVLAMIAVGAFIGPKILVLFPTWLLGVLAWRVVRGRARWQPWAPWVMGASIALIIAMVSFHPQWPAKIGAAPWFFSAACFSNWLFGLGVAGLIVAVDARFHSCRVPARMEACIRRGAGVSFTLYLLHFPLMAFFAGVLAYDRSNAWHVAAILGLVFGIIYFVGSLIEPQRKDWARRFEAAMRALIRQFNPASAHVAGQPAELIAAVDGAPGDAERRKS